MKGWKIFYDLELKMVLEFNPVQSRPYIKVEQKKNTLNPQLKEDLYTHLRSDTVMISGASDVNMKHRDIYCIIC